MNVVNDRLIHLLDSWPCCNVGTVQILDLPKRERDFFNVFMPAARTAIALGHHVTTEEEWTWYATDTGGEYCTADNHTIAVCETIKAVLKETGHQARIVSYPGESGLQFRYVAQAAGLGRIGTNAFLFHPEWGPWIHLRVLATTAQVDFRSRPSGDELCNQCGLCVAECPAGAILDAEFIGLQCRSYRQAKGEYEPYGLERELRYCKQCIWVCPQGEHPAERSIEQMQP